ncbi:hypothetical protein LCGC14_2781490 [marine sediment metagenome]|uniref:Uncharacterized protein n=1 Tax=marine sediment metagenome TaxID=412755 RepID=A0A0F8YT52_9ZZZZ
MQRAGRRLNRQHWLKQLWPRTLYSVYHTEQGREFSIWRQWLGRAYDVRTFPV